MAKLDKLIKEIGWAKIAFRISIVADISLVGWLAQNYNKADSFLLVIAILLVGIITPILFFEQTGLINRRIVMERMTNPTSQRAHDEQILAR